MGEHGEVEATARLPIHLVTGPRGGGGYDTMATGIFPIHGEAGIAQGKGGGEKKSIWAHPDM